MLTASIALLLRRLADAGGDIAVLDQFKVAGSSSKPTTVT